MNPHVESDTRTLILPVCQFQHFRICNTYDITTSLTCQDILINYSKFLLLFVMNILLHLLLYQSIRDDGIFILKFTVLVCDHYIYAQVQLSHSQ